MTKSNFLIPRGTPKPTPTSEPAQDRGLRLVRQEEIQRRLDAALFGAKSRRHQRTFRDLMERMLVETGGGK
jgi:hypothetical protein